MLSLFLLHTANSRSLTSLISNNRLSRSENLVPVLTRYLTTSNKVLWERGGEISPLFRNILIYLYLQESNYLFNCEMWLFNLIFPQFCKSETRTISESPLHFEITRIECTSFSNLHMFCIQKRRGFLVHTLQNKTVLR